MDRQGKQTKTRTPLFDGLNYAFWSIRMKVYLQAQGTNIWKMIVNIYDIPVGPSATNSTEKKIFEDNSKVMNAILSGLTEIVFVKVMHYETAKEIWDKLRNIYEGDDKIKGAKLQTYRAQFENLKMKEEENIAAYFLRVDEIVNIIKGLGEKVDEQVIVQKILRSLPMRFDSKISVVEERSDLDTMTMDELHGTLTAYEMRIEQEDPLGKEAVFKVTNIRRTIKQKPKEEYNSDDDEFDNEEEANFVRKLKRGASRYKGKLPLECFECGRIGHFSSKCPYKGNPNAEDEDSYKKNKRHQKNKKGNNGRYDNNKNLYTKENNNSSDDDDSDSDNESKRVLFLAMDAKEVIEEQDESEEEGEVDLEAELVSAL